MLIGYARVSTEDQNLALQTDALTKAGCKKIYQEKVSSMKAQRPALTTLLSYLRAEDTLVVWKLDRLGRSLKEPISLITLLSERQVNFKSLNENIDTGTPTGQLVFHIFCALAEFEREVIRQRTLAGLQAARARKQVLGRPKGLAKQPSKKPKQRLNCIETDPYRSGRYAVTYIALHPLSTDTLSMKKSGR